MKLLYLGYYIDQQTLLKISGNNPEISIAVNKLERVLLTNLLSNKENFSQIEILSANGVKELNENCVNTVDFLGSNINYFWYKRKSPFSLLSTIKKVKKFLKEWIKNAGDEEIVVLTYAVNIALLLPLFKAIKKKNVKVVTICSEVPQYRVIDGNKIVGKLKYKFLQRINEKMDGYIFLTKYMNEVCNKGGLPWTVVEALPDDNSAFDCEVSKGNYVLYAGGINEPNGINMLVDAYSNLDTDVELWICGRGPSEEYVKQAEKNNPRIKYLGGLANEEVLKLEKGAVLLINPRLPDSMLTRYSFPSKTVEYMLSGTPAIITKLDGIPDEYFDYCYLLNTNSIQEMQNSLREVLSISADEREKMGEKARRFILENKSAEKMVEKIIDFLKTIK